MRDGKARPPGASWFEDGNGACAAHAQPPRPAGMALRAVRNAANHRRSMYCGPLRRTVPALQRMRRACAAAPTGRDGSPSRPRTWWAPAPRAAQCATGIPARGHFPGNAGFQARKPSRKPLASPCACPLRGVAFCSGTPPRSDRGCGGLRAPPPSAREAAPLQKGECVAATYSVAERLRVPTGGAVGCGPHSRRRGKPRRYKKANARPPRIL